MADQITDTVDYLTPRQGFERGWEGGRNFERVRCRLAVTETLREIGAKPGSSIHSACDAILLRIDTPGDKY